MSRAQDTPPSNDLDSFLRRLDRQSQQIDQQSRRIEQLEQQLRLGRDDCDRQQRGADEELHRSGDLADAEKFNQTTGLIQFQGVCTIQNPTTSQCQYVNPNFKGCSAIGQDLVLS